MSYDQLPEGVTRETMDVDVLIVGGGSAGLSCALHLQNQISKHNEDVASGKKQGEQIPEQMIVVLEKASEVGAHSLSGAVLNPTALRELIPNFKEEGAPLDTEVKKDAVYYLGSDFSFKLPVTPPPFHNEGNYITSISKLNRWLATKCEEKGINIFPGFAAVEALYEGNKIVGVRTGDKGRDKNGNPKANFEPGLILKSKVTIFAEGTRGSLFKKVSEKLNLRAGKNKEVFEEGVKEIIQMPHGTVEAGQVIHTMGFPLSKSIGGTFIYTIPGDKIILGLVAYLDTEDPLLDPHRELQKLKTHPFLKNMLKGGKVIAYGGKTLPAGGWYSMPKLYGDGFMVCGDSASMVDVQKLKGIHLAMKSGMQAADTVMEGLTKGAEFTEEITKGYETRIHGSYVKNELYKVRNFHQALSKGIVASMPMLALQEMTGGRGLQDPMPIAHGDAETTEKVVDVWGPNGFDEQLSSLPKPDGQLFFDKLSSVYLTGTMHDEDSPNHLILKDGDICRSVCEPNYKSPCNHFCPASVYEMVPSTKEPGKKDLQINYTNCIHCKTCDIKCPFENIEWTVPEGGGGPQYREV
ncbi:electron transfer flavoprotein-ubiquinone oxidoreductase [Bdellovibrio svalbardensis]|uniref:Electron transfer flavoprotein-ubiquinone oxidoreductase n=1 Tax=Bdellovibrio svalbardensis TaxID=2972972 RepID=A0ABT6DPP2_9BACT|nr:electron transfer flavoprotein-ubiquinone oxidoreductase [Bdellovibrio svalbardensis]MDG0818045.1 electron transfer flavoprotein-ubiquinone oxidoreductase [Bdellovibrio svalbardensis]